MWVLLFQLSIKFLIVFDEFNDCFNSKIILGFFFDDVHSCIVG